MEEEHEPPKPEATPTPPPPTTSNQNLIVGIVVGAFVLLLILLLITKQFDPGSGGGEDSELAKLKEKIEEERRLNENLRLRGIAGASQSPDALVSQIVSDTEALGRLVNASASDAAALRTAQADAAAHFKRTQDLEIQLEKYRAAALKAEDLQRQLNQARAAAQGMVGKSQVDQLQSELNLVKADRDRMQSELLQLRGQQQGMVDSNTYAIVKNQLDELRQANDILRAENQRLRTELDGAKLFVTQEDLSPRAVALYRELKRIEKEDHRQRLVTYDSIRTQLKASVQETISFKTGKADIAREHEATIKDMTTQSPEQSFFLVVGYASPTGDSQTNEELSSKRATRVASMVNYLKREGQGVQAVYLGEGTRFGPEDERNQVCEVWEIRP